MQEVYWGNVKEQKAVLEWGNERGRDTGKKENSQERKEKKERKLKGTRKKRRQIEELSD